MIGQTISHYKITAKLGEGGMGVVYKAEDTNLGRTVALKFLAANLLESKEYNSRFLREARAAALLDHPSICTVYEIGVADGQAFLAMAYLDGQTLKQKIAERPLPVDEALDIAIQIGHGLQAAHERGIVHRDIKPANIMITAQGQVKIMDFGLAQLSDRTRLTASGALLGTPAYMSPEQAQGQPTDRRTDIWSLGVVLYEMLSGRAPFSGDREAALAYAVVHEEPEPLTALRSGVPIDMDRILAKALAKEVANRYQHVADLVVDLRNVRRASSIVRKNPVAAKPRMWLYVVTALCAVLVLIMGALLYRDRNPGPGADQRTGTGKLLVQLDAELRSRGKLGSNVSTDAVISPDGDRVVFVAIANGISNLYTRPLDHPDVTELPGTDGARSPFFSPDGQWVAFWSAGKIKKVPITGGAPIIVGDSVDLLGGSWGDDGNIVAAANVAPTLLRFPSQGGTPGVLADFTQDYTRVVWPQVLPGSKAVLFTGLRGSGSDAANIDVFSIQDGVRKTLIHGGTFGRYLSSGHLVYVNQGTLYAVPFDPDRFEVEGAPVAMLPNVDYSPIFGFAQFDCSQNGIVVYRRAAAGGQSTVQWLDSQGSAEAIIERPGPYLWPRISPDEEKLAIVRSDSGNANIWITDRRTGRMTPLSSENSTQAYPVWNPDGRYIIFSGDKTIEYVRSDGSGTPQVLLNTQTSHVPWSFTPDGGRLAFHKFDPSTHFDIWTVPVEEEGGALRAGAPEPFLQTSATEAYPAFSPDGRWLAYNSNASGSPVIYVRPFPNNEAVPAVPVGEGRVPQWSRRGNKLFFRTLDNQVMVSDWHARGGTFRATPPRQWTPLRLSDTGVFANFDVSPDGLHVVGMLPAADPSERQAENHVTFLMNFFDEIRRHASSGG